jgi:hypothetical protein
VIRRGHQFFAHNKGMPLPRPENLRTTQLLPHFAFSTKLVLVLFAFSSSSWLSAQDRSAPVLNREYASALAAADRFLQDWQAGDAENGMALLTEHAKKGVAKDDLEAFFSSPQPSGYEIGRGKGLRHGRYEFPVALVTARSTQHLRRRFSNIVVVNTGNNDWAIDKLP